MIRARKDDGRTFITTRQPKSGHGPNDAKDIVREDGRDFAKSGIGTMEGEARSRSRDYVLFFGARELSENGLCSSGRRLECKGIHEHG